MGTARRLRSWQQTSARIAAAVALLATGSLAVDSWAGAEGPALEPAAAVQPTTEAPADVDLRPLQRPVVVLYGDSLSWEARDAFVFAFARWPDVQVVTRTMGGIALCDVLDLMAQDVETLQPGAVVLQFSGNALTQCMRGDKTHFARYEADAEAAVELLAGSGIQLVFAGSPRSDNDQGDYKGGLLNATYASVADAHRDVRYVDAGAALLDDGSWTSTLPCLPLEPCTGGWDSQGRAVNVVRARDGGHFCPAGRDAERGVTGECPVWSSGAFRYGNAMASPVIESLEAG